MADEAPDPPPTPTTGRYAGIAPATYTGADRRPVVYLTRRFAPQPGQLALIQEHVLRAGERLDHVAAKYLGDPELFWRLCDANPVMDPGTLEVPGRRLRVTLPAELSWNNAGGSDA